MAHSLFKLIRATVAQDLENIQKMENIALRCNSKRTDLLKSDASNAYVLDAQNGAYSDLSEIAEAFR